MVSNIVRFIISFMLMFLSAVSVQADQTKTLSAGISVSKQIPPALMGCWRVVSKLKETDSPATFKKAGVDIWNLSKTGDVISLSNPFTGASASVSVEFVKNNTVRFTKEGNYDNQKLIDTVEITLSGNKFEGMNYLRLKKYSSADNSLISEKTASYTLRGDKISGASIMEK